ncbi:DUF4031 domain-containing protein [Deinococcus sp. 12RED42]|uniref:DUF4031 domain-containing protein n=1 Tax=Deinococcus sp. 12RED42 TaxID=2745872 RepID=UPI001E61C323|nr:DUF4031 domain-containing protein [Deinococcus sp. 12RED42]MCD0164445.1 DUF4031 domain-containing protein [Deinococcus sp. 12RED42]
MAVYVDGITDYQGSVGGYVGRVSQKWCHMTADTLDELHVLAAKIGLRRAWFQSSHLLHHCHYDLTPSRRAAAVRAGAVEVSALARARQLVADGVDLTPSGLPVVRR